MFHFDRIQQKLLFILCGVILILSGILLYREYGRRDGIPAVTKESVWEGRPTGMGEKQPEDIGEEQSYADSGQKQPGMDEEGNPSIKIYITGQVKSPGVITLSEGDRLEDAIEIAGGALPDADLNRVNLAMKVKDEGMYHVPAVGEEISDDSSAMIANGETNSDAKVNINEADQAQLETLNGIGPAKAQKIIKYREESGGFQAIEEIMNVSGIGEKTFEGLKDQIDIK